MVSNRLPEKVQSIIAAPDDHDIIVNIESRQDFSEELDENTLFSDKKKTQIPSFPKLKFSIKSNFGVFQNINRRRILF